MTQEVYAASQCLHDRMHKWCALESLKGLGAARWRNILTCYPNDPLDVLSGGPPDLEACGIAHHAIQTALNVADERIDHALKWLQSCHYHHILTFDHAAYPEHLAEIPRPPLFLFVKGELSALTQRCLAVVGARAPTVQGLHNAEYFSAGLAQQGWCVISGLARGIDGAAHRATVGASGKTVAVLGTGIDQIYPRPHIKLAEQIVEAGGALISEFPLGTEPRAHHFPRRNRIISGLSLGTLVIEAAMKSGSLLTAREAIEQGRDVFAVPGSIASGMSEGCHWLIQQGAKLVTCIEDIVEGYQPFAKNTVSQGEKNLQKSTGQRLARDRLLDSVDFEVTALDVVARRSKMPLSDVLARLLEYELRGLVAAVPGGYIKLGEK